MVEWSLPQGNIFIFNVILLFTSTLVYPMEIYHMLYGGVACE